MWLLPCCMAGNIHFLQLHSVVMKLPATQEIQVWSLGQEETLEKEMATHSGILAWEIHGQRSLGSQRVGHNWATKQQLGCNKTPQTGWLKIRIYSLLFWKLQVWVWGIDRLLPTRASEGQSVSCFTPTFWKWPVILSIPRDEDQCL